MSILTVTLPDDLAQKAAIAGLLTDAAVEEMLRERLRRQAGNELRTFWTRLPVATLTPIDETELAQAVRSVRTSQVARG